MTFADTTSTSSGNSGIGIYMRLSTEHPTELYIIDDEAFTRWTHWLTEAMRADRQRRGLGITCPGPRSCPVCIRNADIKVRVGEAFRRDKDYRAPRKRFLTNVLNVTPIKVCNCGAIHYTSHKTWPEVCTQPDCKASLSEIEPTRLNRIQVLEGGVTLFKQFNAFQDEITDKEGTVLSLQEFPLRLTTSGEGRNKTTIPVPIMSALGPPKEEAFLNAEGEKQAKIDIAELVQPFTAEEIDHLLKGGSIADIYDDRREKEDEELPF